MSDKTWEVVVSDDPITGEATIPVPAEVLKHLGWTEIDRLAFTPNPDGSFRITKMEPLDYIKQIEERFENAYAVINRWFDNYKPDITSHEMHQEYVDMICARANLKNIFNDMADEAKAVINVKSK